VLAFFLIGLAIFVVLVGAIGFVLLQRHLHARNWTPQRATVEFTGPLCQIQYKDTRYWLTVKVVDCADADQALEMEKRQGSSLTRWRSEKTEYAEVSYAVDGQPRRQRVIQWLVSTRPLTLGEDIGILVDPDNPAHIDRPNTSDDFIFAGRLLFVALIAWFALVFLVWLLVRRVQRKRRHA